MKKILIVSPHTDDGELGCGATMSRKMDEGDEVHYLAFTSVIKTDNGKIDIIEEAKKSIVEVYGIHPECFYYGDMEIRNFSKCRQVILDWMIELNERHKYDMVFIPSLNDTHQDHVVVAQEGLRAFKKTTILGYELPWNNLTFNSTGFIQVDLDDVKKKSKALRCYQSQISRVYMEEIFIESWARMRGTQIGAKFAEMFEVIRWII